ncbi:MAG: helix-turn-helix domain-containing protein [Methanoregula sp.]|jgi:DNA-binding transcriptional ArsR family regulator|nr:helix-turn-helix domain-containing protein [Methanoregula sp.]
MSDNVILLEPGDERAQKIAKAMSSQTASDILQLLAESPRSLTGITERLAIPLTTAKYHTENLLDAGLILIADTKYSVKGREIKIYSLTNQLLIVAPRQSNIRSLLLKYASLFGIVVFGSIVIAILSPILGTGITAGNSLDGASRMTAQGYGVPSVKAVYEGVLPNTTTTPDMMVSGSKGVVDMVAANLTPGPSPLATLASTPMVTPGQIPMDTGASATATIPGMALAFFLGGVLVILVLVCYEIYIRKK